MRRQRIPCFSILTHDSLDRKTTLLSVVTDSIPSNVEARADVCLPGMSAFVPQDDRLHGFYTVRSYLKHYASLAGIAEGQATDEKIDNLLSKLGLSDQADTIVGDIFFKGLSGGQMRRLSLALEALSEPVNFFLDEPTSGLDAESALQVMEFLKGYVRESKGRRVILTIHQPSSFSEYGGVESWNVCAAVLYDLTLIFLFLIHSLANNRPRCFAQQGKAHVQWRP